MCGSKKNQPEIDYSMSPNQKLMTDLFKSIQEPYMQSQYGMYKDIYEPQMRNLGELLGEQVKQPLTLPDDVWNELWNKSREKTVSEYNTQRQSATERAAASGMLGQGPTEKYFQNLDLSQAKSIEDMAVDMAIQQWMERKNAQQQATQNMETFLGYQPAFNLVLPTEQTRVTQPKQGFNIGNLFSGGLQGGILGTLAGVTNPAVMAASIGAGALSGGLQ